MRNLFLFALISLIFIGCAPSGPSAISIDTISSQRSQVAILRVQQRMGFFILGCDKQRVYKNTKFVVLQPGRHLVYFEIQGQNILETYYMRNKKYIDVQAGHTYLLKTKGTGLFVVGDKWFPELFDVTIDPDLNITTIPTGN